MKNLELARRIKELRNRKGFSQEELAERSGLSLRTIQRIENSETEPMGDSLKRLALAFDVAPDEILDWQIKEDNNLMVMLNLSQLSFLAFPILGILIPLVIWILGKDKIKHMNSVGKSILNFQISWSLILFLFYTLAVLGMILHFRILGISSWFTLIGLGGGYYLFNIIMIITNTIMYSKRHKVNYWPSIKFLK